MIRIKRINEGISQDDISEMANDIFTYFNDYEDSDEKFQMWLKLLENDIDLLIGEDYDPTSISINNIEYIVNYIFNINKKQLIIDDFKDSYADICSLMVENSIQIDRIEDFFIDDIHKIKIFNFIKLGEPMLKVIRCGISYDDVCNQMSDIYNKINKGIKYYNCDIDSIHFDKNGDKFDITTIISKSK